MRTFRFLAVLCFSTSAFSSAWASGNCPAATFTAPAQIQLPNQPTLIVTHASTIWDDRESAKPGIEYAAAFAKGYQLPYVFLQDSFTSTYYTTDCQPTYFAYSFAGELTFAVPTHHVISVGGHLEACEHLTVENILAGWSQERTTDGLRLTLVPNAIYLDGRYITPKDPYAKKYNWFKHVYGTDKINLEQLFRVIGSQRLINDFIRRYLATFTFPADHQVEVQINGQLIFVYRALPSSTAPKLTIDFDRDGNIRLE